MITCFFSGKCASKTIRGYCVFRGQCNQRREVVRWRKLLELWVEGEEVYKPKKIRRKSVSYVSASYTHRKVKRDVSKVQT